MTSWHELRKNQSAVFDEVCNFIQQNVVVKGRCYFLTYLHRQYMELFTEEFENSKEVMGNYTTHNLEDKIKKVFTKEIKFLPCHNKKVLAPKHVSVIDEELLNNLKDQDIHNKAALILRKSVLQIEKKKLPSCLSVQDLKKW